MLDRRRYISLALERGEKIGCISCRVILMADGLAADTGSVDELLQRSLLPFQELWQRSTAASV